VLDGAYSIRKNLRDQQGRILSNNNRTGCSLKTNLRFQKIDAYCPWINVLGRQSMIVIFVVPRKRGHECSRTCRVIRERDRICLENCQQQKASEAAGLTRWLEAVRREEKFQSQGLEFVPSNDSFQKKLRRGTNRSECWG